MRRMAASFFLSSAESALSVGLVQNIRQVSTSAALLTALLWNRREQPSKLRSQKTLP